MIRAILRLGFIVIWLWPLCASAEPIKLKFAFVSSDRTLLYKSSVKPFVDAVNAEANGLIEIEVFLSGALGKNAGLQAQMVRDGVADMAYIVPGYLADQFPDNSVLELPGLFRDQREATLVFTRMIAAGTLRGYEDFVVIAAICLEPESIHTRRPIATLANLQNLKIRANNPIEVATLEKLGMKGGIIPINEVTAAMSSGVIDGAMLPPATLAEFGVSRLANYHYMIHASAGTLALVMNRARFASLPQPAQDIIRKYSSEWLATRTNEFFERADADTIAQLQADPLRKVIFPSPADLAVIHAAYRQVIDEWASRSPRNRDLLGLVEAEIAKLRSGQ